MKSLMLCGQPVRVIHEDGVDYFCLTEIWKATGGEDKNRPKEFLRNDKTKDFIDVLEKGGYPPFYKTVGRQGGTWAVEELTFEYVGWVKAEFKKYVYAVLKAYFNGNLKSERQWLMQSELQQFAYDEGRSKEKGTIGSKLMLTRKKEKHVLEKQAVILIKKFQYELELLPSPIL